MKTRYLLIAIFVVGLALRLVTLDAHGFWGDEINSLDGVALGFPDFLWGRFGYVANQTPLHYFMLWITSSLADPASTSIFVRLPSALGGALSIPVMYLLGKEMFGKWQGMVAALMVALSPRLLNFSQDLRLYSLMVLLSALAAYCLLRADKTNAPKWWALFVLAHVGNIANAYVALTLSTPPLGIYLAYVLWKKWQARKAESNAFLYAAIGTVAFVMGTALVALDLLGAPRMAPDWSKVSISGALSSVIEFVTWFTNFGFSGNAERILQLLVLILAVGGLGAAVLHPVRAERRQAGAALAILYIVIPSVMLAVLSTTSVVFQRYAIFAAPFYFALAAHGIVSLYEIGTKDARFARYLQPGRYAAAALGVVVAGAFAYGAFAYENPATHSDMAYRPDYRGAAKYLSATVTVDDTVVFLDDPGLGYTITNYYWHSKPPTRVFDARDPRLFEAPSGGNVYWVVSYEDLAALDALASSEQGWSGVTRFERVAVLVQSNQSGIADAMDSIVTKLEQIMPGTQPVITLRGCIQQARGDLATAAATYKQAGTYFPVGDDYQRTAEGYDKHGLTIFAWREAFISKFWQPFRPQIHEWLAGKLAQEGFGRLSADESEIARLLRANP